MHLSWRRLAALVVALCGWMPFAAPALAQTPRPWQVTLQPAFSPVQQKIIELNHLVVGIIIVISVFVGLLLAYVLFRFSAKRHPKPTRTSHNTVLEVAWTALPILILVAIAIPSFRLVYYEDRVPNPDMTVKVTGHQWYWEYVYPDQDGLDIESRIVPDSDLKPGQLRLLTVDNPLVLPAGKSIRILQTSGDVIHSFFIPSLGMQRYAIPGRTIETWVKVEKPGDYYGECNQICGIGHSQMPIHVHAVTDAEFAAWVKKAKAEENSENAAPAPTQLATTQLAEMRR